MNHHVQAYIDRINADDPTLREINLASLNLGDTYITELMAALTSNPNVAQRIVTLNLADNKLTSIIIPATLVALQWLRLNSNKLTSIIIPEALVALQWLNLERNKLTSIIMPTTLFALEELRLDDNQLTSINIPATLVALKEMRLADNQLTSIIIPATLVALEEMRLADNQLTSINIPATFVALQLLYLERNKLASINIPATLVALEEVDLAGNQLTSINIPEALMALRWLSLEDNPPLTMATKIALEALRRTRGDNNFRLDYDNPVPAETQLTDDILNAHFKPMLRSHPEQIIAHLKKTGAAWLLSCLPSDVAGKISEYVEPIPEIESALVSMTNFQSIFSRSLMLNVDNNEELNTLNLYNETVFQELVKKTKNYYANAFQSKTIVKLGLRLNKFNNQAEGVTPKTGLFSYLLYPVIFIFKAFKFVAITISNVMSKLIYGKSNRHVEKESKKESKIAQAPLPAPEHTKSCLQTFKSVLPCFTLARKRNNTHGSLLPSLTRSTPLPRPHSSSM